MHKPITTAQQAALAALFVPAGNDALLKLSQLGWGYSHQPYLVADHDPNDLAWHINQAQACIKALRQVMRRGGLGARKWDHYMQSRVLEGYKQLAAGNGDLAVNLLYMAEGYTVWDHINHGWFHLLSIDRCKALVNQMNQLADNERATREAWYWQQACQILGYEPVKLTELKF